MKRYAMGFFQGAPAMFEQPDGDYVKWDEVRSGGEDEMSELTKAASDVLAERQRQVEKEGWTPEHDDEHTDGSMARAAAAYCLCAEGPPRSGEPSEFHSSRPWDFNILRAIWPRSWNWPQPKDRRRNLVRAAALLLAEIERMDRAEAPCGVTASADHTFSQQTPPKDGKC